MPRVAERKILLESLFPDRLEFLKFLVGEFHAEYRKRRGSGAEGGQCCRKRQDENFVEIQES
jgi:hypothetical protein